MLSEERSYEESAHEHILCPCITIEQLMPHTLDPDLRRALAERVRYCHEMGIYDFYRRDPQVSGAATATVETEIDDLSSPSQELREEMAARKSAVVAKIADDNVLRDLRPVTRVDLCDLFLLFVGQHDRRRVLLQSFHRELVG